MRYWEACEAQVTAAEAIEECRRHGIAAEVREADGALLDKDSGDIIGHPDGCGILWRRCPRLPRILIDVRLRSLRYAFAGRS